MILCTEYRYIFLTADIKLTLQTFGILDSYEITEKIFYIIYFKIQLIFNLFQYLIHIHIFDKENNFYLIKNL